MVQLIIVGLVIAVVVVSAQLGEPFASEPALCRGLIDYNVWVPPGYTQVNLSEGMIATGILSTSLLPGPCARIAAVAACSQAFRACGTDNLPLPLCTDYCTAHSTEVALLMGPMGGRCSALDRAV